MKICGVKAVFNAAGGFGKGEYLVSEKGFCHLAAPFFDDPHNDQNSLRPGVTVGTEKYIGVLFFEGIPIVDEIIDQELGD